VTSTPPIENESRYAREVLRVPRHEEVYVAEVLSSADPVLAPYEHDAFRRCSFDDALALLRWENNRRAFIAAREFIATGLDHSRVRLGCASVRECP
jgi:hypothetical protein